MSFSPDSGAKSAARTETEPPAALLAHGILEEVYRRREAIGVALVMTLLLLAAAVGLQVWTVDAASGAAFENPGRAVSNSSADSSVSGPSGTWQRWGDLGSQKLSQSPAAVPESSSTTVFSNSADTPTTTTVQSIPALPSSSGS